MIDLNDDPDKDDIPGQLRKRFRLADDAEAQGRAERREDIRFVRLREQWPSYAVAGRNIPGRERPMLVDNRLLAYRNQVINEIRMNSPGMRVRPVDDQADIKTAEVFEGLIRHTMAISNGDAAIDTAAEWQVDTGLGYIYIEPDYCDSESWDQELFIRRVEDPMLHWHDPNDHSLDGSEAMFHIMAIDMPKAEFREEYPDVDVTSYAPLDYAGYDGWITKDTVRVAKYWWIQKETITATHPETGKKVKRYKKRCFVSIVAGDKELDRTELLFSGGEAYIPVVPVYGLDTFVDGRRCLEGLIRNAKDQQRMLNYATSAKAEHVALVTKSPWIGTAEQFEGHNEWDDPNTPWAKMVYNAVDHMGNPLPPPQRGASPSPDSAWIQIEQQAILAIQASMGIYEGALGANPNEQSGKALLSVQRQQSQGTFHFSDNLGRSLKHLAKLLVLMYPKYYDVPRIARIIGEDGGQEHAQIDPTQPQAVTQQQDATGAIKTIYNLGVGKYDVVCDVGPSYATKRQESAESMMQVLQTPLGQGLAAVAGDMIVKQFDWPMSQELSERVKKSMDPKLTQDDGQQPPPEVMQAQQQMEQMAQQMEHLSQVIQQLQDERQMREAELQIKQYEAETHRIAATKETPEAEPGMKDELEYTKAHAAHELEERRVALEYLKAERDYKLELMRLGLDAKQAEAEEEAGEAEELAEAKEFSDTESEGS